MPPSLYTQSLDDAFEDAIGARGANRERFLHWQRQLQPVLSRMQSSPPREAAPIFSYASRSDDLEDIQRVAEHLQERYATLVVAGMGGSSLSGETLAALLHAPGRMRLQFIDNTDPYKMDALIQELDWASTAFLIISKSGNTVETLGQLALLLKEAKARLASHGRHFFVMTVPNGNCLHALAERHGMTLISHDPDLGGRFSILSPVGLLPAAAVGLDIGALRAGAKHVLDSHFSARQPKPAQDSAALHYALMEKDIRIHVTMPYCDRLQCLAAWYRQCWAESLGKCAKATTPVRGRGTTDQHSQLQLYLDGPQDKFFTVMMLNTSGQGGVMEFADEQDERLAFLQGRTLGDLMMAEQRATAATLVNRGCPVRRFMLERLDEEVMGGLLMHFMLEVMLTAELLGVNAFDQPAVEESKRLALHYLAEETQRQEQARRA